MDKANFSMKHDDIKPAIKVLEDALILRTNPDDDPHFDLGFAKDICDDYVAIIDRLLKTDNTRDAFDLRWAAEDLRDVYWRLWEHPFPEGMEMGQPLLSAALERPMRDLIRFLRSLAPDDDDDYMGDRELILVADDEIRIFKKWLDDVSLEPHVKSYQTKGFGLGALAASFFLGTWLGGD